MNRLDKQYTDLLQDILDNGIKKQDRTGTGTISVFGRQIRHDMKDGFPLLTTKKMPFKTIVTELLWFLRGDTNIKYLVDNGCNIWNGDAYQNYLKDHEPSNGTATMEEFIELIKQNEKPIYHELGELGPIYGKQWRSWKTFEYELDSMISSGYFPKEIDQIQNLINDLKTNPDSRRLMVNAWNVGELDQMVLPPCHYGFQIYTRELSEQERINILHTKHGNKGHHVEAGFNMLDEFDIPARAISLMWNQRSVDTALGLPFNIASYAILLQLLGKIVNMVPDQLIGNLGDVHLYSNHIDGAKEQIGRDLTYDEKVEYARSLYGKEEWWDINDKRVVAVLQKKKRTREPFPLPELNFSKQVDIDIMKYINVNTMNLDMFFSRLKSSDFIIENYQSHPTIKFPLSN